MVTAKKSGNLSNSMIFDSENCSICKNLLSNMQRFFEMLETTRRSSTSDWLTVDEIAKELKVSKSIVYRLIRHGELEAVDIVETDGEIAKKGHYHVKKSRLNQYLERKKVKPFPNTSTHKTHSRRVPKAKNHLGL